MQTWTYIVNNKNTHKTTEKSSKVRCVSLSPRHKWNEYASMCVSYLLFLPVFGGKRRRLLAFCLLSRPYLRSRSTIPFPLAPTALTPAIPTSFHRIHFTFSFVNALILTILCVRILNFRANEHGCRPKTIYGLAATVIKGRHDVITGCCCYAVQRRRVTLTRIMKLLFTWISHEIRAENGLKNGRPVAINLNGK